MSDQNKRQEPDLSQDPSWYRENKSQETPETKSTERKTVTRKDRLAWLVNHPEAFERFPASDIKNHHKVLFQAMQSAGLYHPKTEWFTCDIDGLVSDARKARRAKSASHAPTEREHWRCQFCGIQSPITEWIKDRCPKCKRKYDVILAIDTETE